jgi:hypothetical protein
MRIVVPCSRTDIDKLPDWVEAHQKLRCGLNHQLHFVVPRSIESEIQDARVQLEGQFESIRIWLMDHEPQGGWPYAPNAQFYHCAIFMHNENPNIPWQLVEPDCLPIRANCYDLIAAKYVSCGAPFFGKVDKTPWRTDAGKITTSLYGASDLMMSGCAVYPGNMPARPHFTGLMADFMKGTDSTEEAWDMHLRAAMQADGMAGTELIANHWNTHKYRVESGRLMCDARPDHEIFAKNPTWEIRSCGGAVHPDAVMVHGCKDETLFNLVMAGQIPEAYAVAPLPQPVTVTANSISLPQPPTQIPAPSDDRLARLENIVLKMAENIASLSAPPQPPAQPPQPIAPADPELLDRILAELPEVGMKGMLSKLSQKLSTEKEPLKSTITASGKFTIKGPAEWVERIAA